jgi:hypothetical protein
MARTRAAPPASQRSGAQPMDAPHVRQRARSAKKLTSGTSSYQASVRPQRSQCERPLREARPPRDATTPAKEPKAPPTKAAMAAVATSCSVVTVSVPQTSCES